MTVRILVGNALAMLKTLPDESVQCCVTSPPYWGLRDYGTAKWEGGDAECRHRIPATGSTQNKGNNNRKGTPFVGDCGLCGAVRVDAQLGLEKTPDEYVARMVEVFREVRRVLKKDGTLWLNIGDSYANDAKWGGSSGGLHMRELHGKHAAGGLGRGKRFTGLKPKDLVGIPWMLAFALRADGWYLRSDIIWAKPNPMPESVTDRPTKAHEYVFLLSKSAAYFYDADAIAEPVTESTIERMSQPTLDEQEGSARVPGKTNGNMKAVLKRSGNNVRRLADGTTGDRPADHLGRSIPWEGATRNKRTVWEITTQPFSEAHFATMPPGLARTCVLAGAPKGGTVLDPFGGAGTTGLVADRLERDAILIELNRSYAKMARDRLHDDAPLFADVEVA